MSAAEGGPDAPPDTTSPIDAPIDVLGETSPSASEAGAPLEGGDAPGDRTDAGCAAPVFHGVACATDGAQACGYARTCSDVDTDDIVTCTCRSGHYDCGSCPFCHIDQNAQGCGIQEVCDGMQLRQCDGSTVTITDTCTCEIGRFWQCAGGRVINLCSDPELSEGGDTGAGRDAAEDASSDGADASPGPDASTEAAAPDAPGE